MNKKCYKAPMAKFHELRCTMVIANSGSGDDSNGPSGTESF